MIGIYKITNPNGKVYIGQSIDIERRWAEHKTHKKDGSAIYNSLHKYGVDRHSFSILEECNISELNKKERYYQEKYNSVSNGLNCRYVKDGDRCGKMSDEVKQKISKSHKGKVFTKQHKESISKARKRLGLTVARPFRGPYTDEYRKKMSEVKKGHITTEETKEKIRQKMIGRHISKKWRENISNALRKPIYQICPNTGDILKEYPSMSDADKDGYNIASVSQAIKLKKMYPHKNGYIWKLKC